MIALIGASAMTAPSALALDGVSLNVQVPQAPTLPSVLPAVPAAPVSVPTPAAPSLPAAPVSVPLTAPPVASVSVAPVRSTATSTTTVPVRPYAAGPSASGPAAPAPSESHARRAARQTRRVRRTVLHMRGCLWALGRRQQRYLSLRAGLGRSAPLGRAAAANRVRVPQSKARSFERRALRSLRQVCGGSSSSTLATRQRAYVAQVGTTPTPAVASSAAAASPGPSQTVDVVLRTRRTADREPTGAPGGDQPTHPNVVPRVAATGSEPAGGGLGGVWIAAALAALAALAGASLVRGRLRPSVAPAAVAAMPGFAAAAPPEETPQTLVSMAFEALSSGDIAGASALMHPDVRWPDLSDGTLEGRTQFEDYWAERLRHVRVDIEPIGFERRNGELIAEVNEVIRGRHYGTAVGEYHAVRRFTFRDGLIAEMKRGRG